MTSREPKQKTKKELLTEVEKLERITKQLYGATLYMSKQVGDIEAASNNLLDGSRDETTITTSQIQLREALSQLGMPKLTAYIHALEDIAYLKSNPTEIN